MALADNPKALILRMFDMECREGRGESCQTSETGFRPDHLALDEEEFVYGIYKDMYYFSPNALYINVGDSVQRIAWSMVASCSTSHGDGNKYSKLVLTDGVLVEVRIGDLVTGWAGRTSQLFHKMIERWGHQAFTGLPLKTIDGYFNEATDKYSFAPNLDPHPSLDEIKAALLAFQEREDIAQVMISIAEYDGSEPVATGIVIVSATPMTNFADLRRALSATDIIPASDNTRKKLAVSDDTMIWEMVWT